MSISRRLCACFIFCLLQTGCARDPIADLAAQLNDPNVAVRRAAARSLGEQPITDERIVAALTKGAADTDMEVRYRSIEPFGRLGRAGKPVIPVLKKALADPEKRVRLEAALALARIDPQDTAPRPLLIAALREGDGRILLATGAMGNDAAWAVPTLVGLLSHNSPQVRAIAAKTLGRIGPAAIDAKPALEAARRDANPVVQNAAKEALSHFQKPNGS